ncbi:MAG TPA: YfhO family protein [bacterium]|nr:YfhO family protein [bacterium]
MSLLSRAVTGLYFLSLILRACLWRGRLPYHIDAALYAYPDHAVNLEAFRQGFLPLWNPYIGCGTPHLANWQSACLYPPFWLFNLTGLSNWLMWMALAHAGLAFGGAYFWLRSQKASPLLCALGALSFAGSAHLVCCLNNLPFIATASWIPWIFWAARRALEKPVFKSWCLTGLCLGLQVLAGYPFFAFYTVLFLVAWFEFQKPSPQTRGGFWLALGGAALATCLQWLPFLELLTYAKPDRWAEYPYFDRPLDYLTLFKPDWLGLLGSASYRGPFANGNFNLYFGLIPLGVLVLNGAFLFRLKSRFWTLASLAWLLWLAGAHFPPWNFLPLRLLEWLEPSKAVGVFLFCAITSVALSLQAFFEKRRGPFPPGLLAALLALLWTLDMGRTSWLLLNPMPDPYQEQGLLDQAKKMGQLTEGKRMLSLHSAGEMASTGTQAQAMERTFELQTHNFLANSNAVWGLRSADQYLFLQVDGSGNLVKYFNRGFPYEGSLLDVAGVRLFLQTQALPAPKYEVAGRQNGDFLNLNSQASADMRWVGDKTVFPDRPAALNSLLPPGNDWRKKIYLERGEAGGFTALAALHRSLPPAAPEESGYSRKSAGRAFLRENFSSPGYVVFNETYAPGWHAWVDGNPTPILRSYGLFMGVAVPGGKGCQVDFRYEPASFRLGLFISLMTLALVAGGFFRDKMMRLRSH